MGGSREQIVDASWRVCLASLIRVSVRNKGVADGLADVYADGQGLLVVHALNGHEDKAGSSEPGTPGFRGFCLSVWHRCRICPPQGHDLLEKQVRFFQRRVGEEGLRMWTVGCQYTHLDSAIAGDRATHAVNSTKSVELGLSDQVALAASVSSASGLPAQVSRP